jgi:hypothetical protein
MPVLYVFLLKVNLSLILFCIGYFLVLRRLTYYKLNRVFLLTGIVFSSIYPFLDFSFFIKETQKLQIPIQQVVPSLMERPNTIDWWFYANVIFFGGVALMAVRMAIRLYSLYLIHKQSIPSFVNNYAVRLISGNFSTFSFWKMIYLNPGQHKEEEVMAVLEHEQVHINDFHTLDILLAELATICYWFNPGIWFMRKAVKENVEFITDQTTLNKGIDRKAYQYSMLRASTGIQSSMLMNNFNITAIKRRIIMMNSKKSSSFHLLKYVLLIPVIILFTTAFTINKKEKIAELVQKNSLEVVTNTTPFEAVQPAVKTLKVITTKGPVKTSTKQVVVKNKQISGKIDEVTISTVVVAPAQDSLKALILKNSPLEPKKTIRIIGVGAVGITAPQTYINDVAVSSEEINKIDPNTIIRMNVNKSAKDPKKNEIYIYTNTFKN